MTLSGEVERVIFRNPDNGWTVVEVRCEGRNVTAVGTFPDLYEGELVEMDGDYKRNERHGTQFTVVRVRADLPGGAREIEKFLMSGFFPGVGEATARKIVSKFGDQALNVIRYEPSRLLKIRGISPSRASSLSKILTEHGEMQSALVFLQKFDLTLNLALRIYKTYGANTENVVKTNPYRLAGEVERVGFATADRIAAAQGIAKDSDFRIKAGIVHALKQASERFGHTALPEDQFYKEVFTVLGFDSSMYDKVRSAAEDLASLSEIMQCVKGRDRFFMTYSAFRTEKFIADSLIMIKRRRSRFATDYSRQIAMFENMAGITLHEKQREAVNHCLNAGVHIVTGGPGTGKTTIIKCILHVLNGLGRTWRLCAPTGRAAKRMNEATGAPASTIHRLLGFEYRNGKGAFRYNAQNRLPADVIIMDEVSMTDEYVFSSLVAAVEKGSSLILVGDKDQLPSVGAGNVLADLLASGLFGVTCLDKIYRQDEKSTITFNAHEINNGRLPDLANTSADFFYLDRSNPRDQARETVSLAAERLPAYLDCSPSEIQVMCPVKKGEAGVVNLNKRLQQRLNPSSEIKKEVKCGDYVFREGDRIMQSVNNYGQEWSEVEHTAHGTHTLTGCGVFNGDTGTIVRIGSHDSTFTVHFDDNKVAVYPMGDIDQLIPAYAVSVHKSQGSEFRAVVICLQPGNTFIMTRNLLYTAVTRAKKMVVIVGSGDVVEKMVKNTYTAKRYTLLRDFLKDSSSRL